MEEITQPDNSDRLGLYLTAGAAAIGIVIAVVSTVSRLLEVAPGHDIPVRIALDAQATLLPLGLNGAPVDATVDAATVLVADPAPATLFALWAQPIVAGLTWSGLLVVAALFCLRLARAQVFSTATARLLYLGGGILTVGYFFDTILSTMTSNGALSAISDGTYEAMAASIDLAPAIGVLVLAAVGTAVQVGERLQRETAGLV